MGILRRGHRYMGLLAMVFVAYIAATGILLNHSDRLGLGKIAVSNRHLLRLYGVTFEPPTEGYMLGAYWISHCQNHIFFDDRPTVASTAGIIGAMALNNDYFVFTEDHLYRFDSGGELIEKVGAELGLPRTIQRCGIASADVIVQSEGKIFRADPERLEWRVSPSEIVTWTTPSRLPESVRDRLRVAYRGAGFSLERVLLDLHSGRIFKCLGVWIADAVAIAMILLSITGLSMHFLYKPSVLKNGEPTREKTNGGEA